MDALLHDAELDNLFTNVWNVDVNQVHPACNGKSQISQQIPVDGGFRTTLRNSLYKRTRQGEDPQGCCSGMFVKRTTSLRLLNS